MNGEVRRMPRLSTRTILLLLFPTLLALGVVSLRPAQAAAPAATTEVNQVPSAGSAVAAGVTVTYTATVVLSAGQAQSLTIQMSGSANITDRALVCTSTTNGAADTVGWGGAPSCLWNGPVLAGTFTFVFSGKAAGPIASLLPGSVVCTDTNSSNTCNDEVPGDRLALSDGNGDVGPIALLAPPFVSAELNQAPPGGSAAAYGAVVTYTATVSLTVPQTWPLTIQLKDQPGLTERTLTCSSSSNGPADNVRTSGAPSCIWDAPVLAGTFLFTFTGKMTAPVTDAGPSVDSVVCTDTDADNLCSDEDSGNLVALGDADANVGPLTLIPASVLTSEVSQVPVAGTLVSKSTRVTYVATVNLTVAQDQSLTIQLAGDPDLANRTLTCTSTTNGGADVVGSGGAPSCMWNGPVTAGVFTFTFAGDAMGAVGDAVPDAASVACKDFNSSNTCSDENLFYQVPLADADGDVGALPFQAKFVLTLPLVAKD
ncbi:hypothetical protein [Candidatus Amarobacter glycogenicus]|uniref:hypothetical protein n=1 Tax=Candidatus Amarobacter glycogenicus TaxID=3140699 RepID=UPI002A152C7E|nr:hypothetical protein [Dehalococcoidia bacterium]